MNVKNKAATPAPTVGEALRSGTEFLKGLGIESARLEMEIILADALGVERLGLYLDFERKLTEPQRERSRALLSRRRKREPLAYILGQREFYGLPFKVTPAVLIPRPETELIVDRAIEIIRGWQGSAAPRLADIGTGSGAICIAVAKTQKKEGLPGRWIATDTSAEALEIARENAAANEVEDRIEFREGSMYQPLGRPQGELPGEPCDLICSNPPYVAEAEEALLSPEVLQWEPRGALFSGDEGMEHLKELIARATEYLRPGGTLLLEIGFQQSEAVEALLRDEADLHDVGFLLDISGIPRVAQARRQGSL